MCGPLARFECECVTRFPPSRCLSCPPLLLDWTLDRFVNRDDIDFGLAHDLPAVQTLEMVRDSGGVEVRRSHPFWSPHPLWCVFIRICCIGGLICTSFCLPEVTGRLSSLWLCKPRWTIRQSWPRCRTSATSRSSSLPTSVPTRPSFRTLASRARAPRQEKAMGNSSVARTRPARERSFCSKYLAETSFPKGGERELTIFYKPFHRSLNNRVRRERVYGSKPDARPPFLSSLVCETPQKNRTISLSIGPSCSLLLSWIPSDHCPLPTVLRARQQFRHGVVECVYEAKPMAEDHKAPAGETGGRNVL